MYAAISRFEPVPAPSVDAGLQRIDGAIRLGFRQAGTATALAELYQRSPGRVLLPRVPAGAPPEAVLLNTAGGLTGGDRMSVAVSLSAGADAVVTTQAAEKLYRALDRDAEIDVSLSLASGASLEWLPQETIAFDGGRMQRRIDMDLAADSRLLMCECLMLGRSARGERFATGRLSDRWQLRREGRLIWADAFRLVGDAADRAGCDALLAGARAMATLVYAGPDVERWRERLRSLSLPAEVRCGVGALSGLLLVRLLSTAATPLRQSLGRLVSLMRMEAFGRAQALPKMWAC